MTPSGARGSVHSMDNDSLRLALVAAAVVWLAPRMRELAVVLFETVTRRVAFVLGWIIGLPLWLLSSAIGRVRRRGTHQLPSNLKKVR